VFFYTSVSGNGHPIINQLLVDCIWQFGASNSKIYCENILCLLILLSSIYCRFMKYYWEYNHISQFAHDIDKWTCSPTFLSLSLLYVT